MTWFKEGKPLKNTSARTSQDGDVFILSVASASLLDAGEYTITANNAAGGTFTTVNVTIEGKYYNEEYREGFPRGFLFTVGGDYHQTRRVR